MEIPSFFHSQSSFLFDHIDDSLPCPPKFLPSSATETNLGYLQWLSRDQALITLINATLSPSALAHVALEKRHSSNT
uniref:Uncharacterized protein n=1 Tax=Cucumis melo TaxID=3656 RepID=A0A9I9EH30_CUCME